MAYSNYEDWFYMPYIRYERVCTAWSTTYNNTLMHQYEKMDNPVDRRNKPDDLIGNMTAQPKQFEARSLTGIVCWGHAYAPDYSCAPPRPNFATRKWGYSSPGYQYAIDGSLSYDEDWATKIRLKIKDTTINLGTTLAEYRQSVNMFGNAAEKMVDAWRSFRKKKAWRGVSFCSIPSSYLVYTYGINPLLSDLYDTVEALTLRLEHPVRRKFYTKVGVNQSKQVSSNWGDGPMEIYARVSQTQRVNCYVEFDLQKASLFRFGNPAEIAWELVPYSFVVDGIIPVGDFLASLDAMNAVSTCAVSRTIKVNYDHKAILKRTDMWGIERTSNHDYSGNGARNATRKYRSHERVVSNSVPLPAIPTYSPSTSYKKLVNNLFLLWQTFGARPGSRCGIRRPRYLPGLGVHHIIP